MDGNTVLRRAERVAFESVAGEAILIRLDTGVYFSLNQVGTHFWHALDGARTLAEHGVALTDYFNRKTDAFFNEAAALAGATDDRAVVGLADDYGVPGGLVRESVARLKAGETPADLARDFYVTPGRVTADLLELAQQLAAESLVETA